MDPSIESILKSEKEVWCELDVKLRRHGNCLSLLDDSRLFVVSYVHGIMEGIGYLLDSYFVLQEFVFSQGNLISSVSHTPEESIVDIDTGTRFEGLVYDSKPYGFGVFYDDDGIKIYEGIMIDWKKFGYGVSYYNINNGVKYEGYWLDNKYHGSGSRFALNGDLLFSGYSIYGEKVSPAYNGNGGCLNTSQTHITLTSPTSLKQIKFSDYKFESISIQGNCSCKNHFCHFTNLPVLQLLEIHDNCFKDKPSQLIIENCPILSSIYIGDNSFTNGSLEISSTFIGFLLSRSSEPQ